MDQRVRGGRARRDGAEQRGANGSADLLGCIEKCRGDARLARVNSLRADVERRDHGTADAKTNQHRGGEGIREAKAPRLEAGAMPSAATSRPGARTARGWTCGRSRAARVVEASIEPAVIGRKAKPALSGE